MQKSKNKQNNLKGVLFDMDGVLLDSEEFITRAGMEMFREKGYVVGYDEFKEFTGMGEDRFLGGVAEKNNIEFHPEKDKARTYEIYSDLISGNLKPLPGVKEFISECKSKGLKTAIATSADKIKMIANLKEIGFEASDFDAVVNGLEVEKKKPHPEIFQKAASRLGLDTASCLVVEDAVSGVEAAKKAGCRCLALTTSFKPEDFPGADWIAGNLAEAPVECLSW